MQKMAGIEGADNSRFDQRRYDELKKVSPTAAEAYKSSFYNVAAEPTKSIPGKSRVDYAIDRAEAREKKNLAAAGDLSNAEDAKVKEWYAPPKPTTGPLAETGGEESHLSSLTNYENARPRASEESREALASAVQSAKEPGSQSGIAMDSTRSRNIPETIEKLKKTEGPDFWDALEAAASGWVGRESLYSQKKRAERAEEAALQKMQEAAKLSSAEYAQEKADADARLARQMAFEREQAKEDAALRLQLAGMSGVQTGGFGGASRLNPLEFAGLGGK